MVAKCRSCGAPVLWTRTRNGKNMPINPYPHEDGNVQLLGKDGRFAAILPPAELKAARLEGTKLYRNHYVTCPQAGQWRK